MWTDFNTDHCVDRLQPQSPSMWIDFMVGHNPGMTLRNLFVVVVVVVVERGDAHGIQTRLWKCH